ncbi:L-rhamnose mutarotase [Tunturiibacter empetritectus]|uniref:L-rhamnose mutarotase n=2 Tax=Tunturiibacter TaxID=3154218 RepID=A0A852VIB3_9BACT|nr:L-rhamnose mutarotase [Edaphobacter lichenicola]NYF90194.1 L-rhamnose mutarotase [Edaphobacter lichenicola]
MKRFCLTLSLRPDPELIAEYIEHHRIGRPEIHQSIRDAGVLDMEIFHLQGILFMIMDTTNDFTFERKAEMDRLNPAVQAWESLMSSYQNVSSGSDPSTRWRQMEKIFKLAHTTDQPMLADRREF